MAAFVGWRRSGSLWVRATGQLDLYPPDVRAAGPNYSDGIHPSDPLGQQLMANIIVARFS